MSIRINRPITPQQRAAKIMLNDAVVYSKNLNNSILNFLNTANKSGLHGPSVVSFFSELNNLRKEHSRDFCYELIELIEQRVCKTPALKRRGNIFMERLKRKYPKYLDDRLTLANYGCVDSSGVKKQNIWKKMLISVMHYLRG